MTLTPKTLIVIPKATTKPELTVEPWYGCLRLSSSQKNPRWNGLISLVSKTI